MKKMEPDYKAIGERVKTLRQRKGLSQEAVAEACGLSKTHLRQETQKVVCPPLF